MSSTPVGTPSGSPADQPSGHAHGEGGPAPRWRLIGPGLVVAATGVGAADLVATLVAGSRYGYALLWTAVVGVLLKIVLVEGAGRYSLLTGRTIFQGWSSLGRWTHWYFGPYIVVWGFVYGAAAMAGTGLPLHALFPAVSVTWWGIASGLVGAALVLLGRYGLFEKVCSALVLFMFVTMVGAAVLAVPNVPDMVTGLVPTIPDGSLVYVLGLAGGVGGTITLAAYGYWLREKGWATPRYLRVMRVDNVTAYVVTGIFVIATLVVGAELLYSAGIAVSSGDQGLLDLGDVIKERYGTAAGTVFLVGFWSAAMSSLIGVWNGVSLMFADFVGHVRAERAERAGEAGVDPDAPAYRLGGRWYRLYVLWLTVPPMAMLFLGKPVYLILAYGVLGAVFMPFLAVTLLWLLNTHRVPAGARNGWLSNAGLAICAALFGVLALNQLADLLL
ncbi:Nramp family divalent metal transporter [Nocardioides bruguierae]|uniref:Nramp family divalent metal transporter n=1 Tax=Nocardioides bruguierae TaxID=2945102 RepID=UPI00202091F0|nr:Nramp family divalent metal transporter [Nocardioides bruguierae]MCL8024868.1 Nramp family divalent metal transporter [Nocardioides bruguierae]